MDLDCDDSEHYQLVLAPFKSSPQDEPSTYAADSITPTNRNIARHRKTFVPALDPSHAILCGKAPENAPGTETTLTCARNQPAKIGRIDVPAFTTSMESKHNKRQGLHATGSHRQWVPDTAEPTNKTNSKPLVLQPTFYARGGLHDRYSTPSEDEADESQFQRHGMLRSWAYCWRGEQAGKIIVDERSGISCCDATIAACMSQSTSLLRKYSYCAKLPLKLRGNGVHSN